MHTKKTLPNLFLFLKIEKKELRVHTTIHTFFFDIIYMHTNYDLIIVGAGAAGLMAATVKYSS